MSEHDDEGADIIEFRPASLTTDDPNRDYANGPIETKVQRHDRCRHRQVILDEKLRTVECRACSVKLDPIEVLLNWRLMWREIQGARIELRREQEAFDRKRARRQAKKSGGEG